MASKASAKSSPVRSKPTAPPSAPAADAPAPTAFQWNRILIVGGVLLALWVLALASRSRIFIVVVGVLTALVVGVLGWMYRWATRQRKMMELLQTASLSPEARRDALAKLQSASGADKDALNVVARANLEAQEDPVKALATLEALDLAKVPVTMADDVRAFRAQLCLLLGRAQDARALADDIKLSQVGTTEARGMMAATVAEAWARTGKHKEAMDLLQTIKPEDPDFAKAKVHLLFARIYAGFAAGARDSVKRDLRSLMSEDVNLLARFVMPKAKVHPQLKKMAEDTLRQSAEVRKMAAKQQRGARRGR